MRRNASIVLLLGLAGCASISGGSPKPPEHDGQTFGVVEGTFRGRWWSFYERGRSYLDGGFYAEAEADFRTALALRAEDQRWARTYGLHFIPEYFPNRDLGIARFHQGKLDDAQSLLERSLKQERTALAAHFLDEVRAAKISQNGGDHEPPTITADSTALAQDAADGMRAMLHARVSDNTYVTGIEINGEPYPIEASAPSIEIAAPVPVSAGTNDIMIRAVDIAGNKTETKVQIHRDFDGPSLSFDSPTTADMLSGTVYDPAGVKELKIGDAIVALQPSGNGAERFSAALSPEQCNFTATDSLGNVTTGRVPGFANNKTAALSQVRFAANTDNTWLATALADAGNTTSEIRLANLAPGQRYLMDEIVVAIEANDPEGIASIELQGTPLPGIIKGASSQFLSRRLLLSEMGQHTIHAKLTNSKGKVREMELSIERAPTDIERPEERLRVALLGNLWEGAGPNLENEANFVAEELTGALFKRGRVDVVSRDALPRVLQEQELRTVLGSRNLDPGLRQIVPADILAVGKVRHTGDTLEIVLQAVSSETSNILGYADVAGPVSSLEDLRALTRDLAVRFEQEFPRVSGSVVNVPAADKCFSSLGEADRVRPELPCLVYRLGEPIVHPQTGAILGRPTQIVARGNFTEVQRQMSKITFRVPGAALGPVQVNDHVATR